MKIKEAAEIEAVLNPEVRVKDCKMFKKGFIKGAKWMQEQLRGTKSDAEVRRLIKSL